jgi:enoyl-[acyl-carrier protein] reductase I
MMKSQRQPLLTLSYLAPSAPCLTTSLAWPKPGLETQVSVTCSLGPEGTRVNAISAGPIRNRRLGSRASADIAANEKQTRAAT